MGLDTTGTPLTAVALDGTVDVAAAVAALPWPERHRYPYAAVLEPEAGERLFLFHFGAVAQVGRAALDVDRLRMIGEITGRRPLYRTSETYTLVEAAEGAPATPRIDWDRIALPDDRPDLVAAAALLIAQSAALERYEIAADGLVEEALELARALERAGRPPRRSGDLVRRVGRITGERLGMTRWFYLVDRPEETWRDPRVAELYDALFQDLELARRHEAMLHKLRAVEETTEMVIDLGHGRQSTQLEWAVVLLIVFEILFSLWEHFLA
jgi:uncharacterized Rmd1/YagE family protein